MFFVYWFVNYLLPTTYHNNHRIFEARQCHTPWQLYALFVSFNLIQLALFVPLFPTETPYEHNLSPIVIQHFNHIKHIEFHSLDKVARHIHKTCKLIGYRIDYWRVSIQLENFSIWCVLNIMDINCWRPVAQKLKIIINTRNLIAEIGTTISNGNFHSKFINNYYSLQKLVNMCANVYICGI